MNSIADGTAEFARRLDLVRRIAQLNARRTQFSGEEELQFIVAARLFTSAELHAMHESAQAAAWQTPSSKQGHNPTTSVFRSALR